MKSYAQQKADAQTVIEANLEDPGLTLLELSEMVGYSSNNFAHRILSYYYAANKEAREAEEREEERHRALERAMAFVAEREAYKLLRMPMRFKTYRTVESRATR